MAFQKPSHTFTKIHLKALRTNNFYIVFILSFTVFINTFSYAQEVPKPKDPIKPKPINDTLVVGVDSLFSQPINIKEKDTLVSDSIPKKKEFLTDVVKYKAKEYVSINQRLQKIYLYDEAEVYYQDMEIKSGIIVIDYSKNLVYAGRLKDSAGVYSQAPKFKQGANLVEPDSIIFNTETKKALIYNSRTEQSGGYIDAALTKKENDSVVFLSLAPS